MTEEPTPTNFLDAATTAWDEYRVHGPGGITPATAANLRTAIAVLDESAASDPHVSTLVRLLVRAVERPEGLSFVTGEAGLLPRTEWHDAIDSALRTLRDRSS